MVTTRRTPGTPAGRANASTPLPKPAKARVAAPVADTQSIDTLKKGKQKPAKVSKPAHKKHKKRASLMGRFFDLVSRAALLWFTVYTLSVCPEDDALQSPVCRGLYHYRKLVLEPYIFPPLQRAFAHPAIAPYVDAVQPHITHAIDVATPLAISARDSVNAHVIPQWNKRVVPAYNAYVVPAFYTHVLPQWNAHVVPQWNAHVVPQWNAHAQPLYDAHVAPHVARAGPYAARAVHEYHARVVPGARTAAAALAEAQRAAQPYVIIAANKAHEAYVAAQPYAAPAWARVKDVLAELLALLAVQRRKFVDPHVAQIWDRVLELSGVAKASAVAASGHAKAGAASVSSAAVSASSVVSSASSAVSSSASSFSSSIASTALSAASVVSSKASSASSVASSKITSASSIASFKVTSASSVASSKATSASSKATSASSVVSSSASSASSVIASSASSASSVVSSRASSASPVAESAVAVPPELHPEVRETTSANPHTTVTEGYTASASSVASQASASASSVVGQASAGVGSAASAASAGADSVASAASSVVSQATASVASAVNEATESASSLAAAAAESTHSAKAAGERIVAAAAGQPLYKDAEDAASFIGNAASSSVASVASRATAAVVADDEDDEDEDDAADFLHDLGFSPDYTPLEDEAFEENEAQSPAAPEPETEEQKAAKLARTAEKRADVTARHADWEAQLADAVKEQTRGVRKSLLQARKRAAAELGAHAEIRLAVDGLAGEADKLVRGAEGYLKTLRRDAAKPAAEKADLWARIVDKVEAKFTKRVGEVERVVNAWYDGVTQQELNLVQGHCNEVLVVANAAQENIGMDYIWLEDVSYHDWQRYHDLMRTYEKFMDKSLAVQNGTWAKPIKNVVQEAIDALEQEVSDVVGSFETRLTSVNRDGAQAFAATPADADVPDVSVPIVAPEETAPGAAEVPPVMIGRGAAEVQDALGRVDAQEVTEALAPATPDAAKSGEELVGELVDEVEGEGKPAAIKNVHVEL